MVQVLALVVVFSMFGITGCGGGGPYVQIECSGLHARDLIPQGCTSVTYPSKPAGWGGLPACGSYSPPAGHVACRKG